METAAAPRLLAGRYRVGELLGRGGMAEVYDGHDQRLGRPVAIKLLRPDMAVHPDVRDRFEAEAQAAARLSHPNVVSVFDTGEDGGTPFIVMERLPGKTMADVMAAGPADQVWLRRVAGDVLGALGAAHAAGIIHRDIKPNNILIADDGCAKVADFGIAKSAEAVAGDPTAVGILLGTPAYLAPERLEGHPATERSDLYAVGVVLYEALSGAKPFSGTTPLSMATAIHSEVPRPLGEVRPDVDPALAAAVDRALAKDPAERPGSAREMAAAVRAGPADRTVHDADRTMVATPGQLGAPVAAAARAGAARVGGTGRRAWALAAAVAALVLLFVVLASAGGDGDGDQSGERLRQLALRVEEGDGAKGPDAAAGLRQLADQVDAGSGAEAATALLANVQAWQRAGQLSDSATLEINALVADLVGGSPSTTAAPPTAPAPVVTTMPAPPPAPVVVDIGPGDGDRGKERRKDRDADDD